VTKEMKELIETARDVLGICDAQISVTSHSYYTRLNDALDAAERALEQQRQTYDDLWKALEESVKLQSHYAVLLNHWDGGERIQFGSATEWVGRLVYTGTIRREPPTPPMAEPAHKYRAIRRKQNLPAKEISNPPIGEDYLNSTVKDEQN